MLITNDWWCFPDGLDAETCATLISWPEGEYEEGGTTGDLEGKRESEIKFITSQWITDIIWPYMLDANEKAGWNFDIESVEAVQITKYGKDGYYGWHYDGGSDVFAKYRIPENEFLNDYVRKLSMTIQLNDDFQGGEFQIANYEETVFWPETPPGITKGSIIIFPSFKEHRISPVTNGERHSLVAWFCGKPFR